MERLETLNTILMEYGVLLASREKRQALLTSLMASQTSPADLRAACRHLKRVTSGNVAATIVQAIRDDPKLRAPLRSAELNADLEPGKAIRDDNMARHDENPEAVKQRLAMEAHCAMTYGECSNFAQLAARLGTTVPKAEELAKIGAGIYGVSDGNA